MAMAKLIDPKDPDEILDYTIDMSAEFSGRLEGADDSIGAPIDVVWVIPDGLTKTAESLGADGQSCTVWLSGGEVGAKYIVTARMTTIGGRVYDRSFILKIKEK